MRNTKRHTTSPTRRTISGGALLLLSLVAFIVALWVLMALTRVVMG